jgi:voltage-gated potassium channel
VLPRLAADPGKVTRNEPPAANGILSWRRPLISFVGLLVAYYAVPSGVRSGASFFIGVVCTAVAVGVLGWAIAGQVRRQVRGDADVALQTLLILVELTAVVFAYGYFLLERTRPGEVSGLQTKTDSLYFTVVTMTTIGYGDVHAAGQVARGLVIVQAAFNVIFVGALVSIVSGQLRTRATQRAQSTRSSKDAAAPKDPDPDRSGDGGGG